jgi:hypothetical protein
MERENLRSMELHYWKIETNKEKMANVHHPSGVHLVCGVNIFILFSW